MAKSGSSMDVEDVLSSIRRLVSEETKLGEPLRGADRGATEDAAPPKPDRPRREGAGRLVLTEALRIAEDDAAATDGETDGAEDDANVSALAEEAEIAAEPDFPAEDAGPEDTATDAAAPAPVQPRRISAERPRFQLLDDLVAETLGRRRGEDADAAPEVAEEPPAGADQPDPEEVLNDAAELPDLAVQADEADADGAAAAMPEDDPDMEQPVLTADDTEDEPAPAVRTRGLQLFDEDSDVLDEETLRVMVAQIVREELMGELGDRITRNVRKLVRREINRALAGKEFE